MIILKSKREIAKLRECGRRVSEVLNTIAAMVEPGIETIELDRKAEEMIRNMGAVPAFKGYRGYPATICASINEEVVHGIPGKRELVDGDIISIDVGLVYDGFIGDMACTVGVGTVAPEQQRLMDVTQQALKAGIAAALPQNRLSDISHAIQQCAEGAGFSVVRDFVGHGIGASMHEEPKVPNFGKPHRGPRLSPGMVICLEPMVNIGGWQTKILEDDWTTITLDRMPSAHFEDMVAITPEGNEVLTCLKKSR